jgi:hypothetical protein
MGRVCIVVGGDFKATRIAPKDILIFLAQVLPVGSFFDRGLAAGLPQVAPFYPSSRSEAMRQFVRASAVGLLGLALLASPAAVQAFRIQLTSPIPERVATADMIVVGKIASIGKESITVKETGQFKLDVSYSVAVVEVKEAIQGAKGMKKLDMGFPATAQPGLPRIPSLQVTTFTQGQELCLLLKKHPSEKFYVVVGNYDYNLNKKSPSYRNNEALIKRCAKLLAEPDKNLKSRVRADRVLTASMLVYRYRNPVGTKEEEVDDDQSKLIMKALAEADWKDLQPVFFKLGVNEKDGWKGPQAVRGRIQTIEMATRDWLKANAGKYRIKRYVAEEESKEGKESKETKKTKKDGK